MPIFKTSGFISKIEKIQDKNYIYTIFSYDYGKIKANKKNSNKEKNLDLGYIANFEIETKEGKDIHKIRNVSIRSEFLNKNRNFGEINSYMLLLSIINSKTPYGEPIQEIYEIIDNINKKENIDENKIILSILKVLSILGELKEENNNKIVEKILRFIQKNKIDTIIKLKGINEEIKIELEKLF